MRSLTVKLSVILAIPIVAVSYTNCANYSLQNYELSAEGLKQGLAQGELIINGGAEYTNNLQVTVSMVHENADEMYVTDDKNCESGGTWEDYAPIKAWTLRNSDGKVYARYRRAKTPDIVSQCFEDSIKVDKVPPVASIPRTPGEFINTNPVYLEIKSSDADSGIARIECDPGAGFPTACQAGATSHSLSDGSYSVRVVAIDKAGNRSEPVSTSFTVDRTPPKLEVATAPTGVLGNGNATFEFSAEDKSPGSGVAGFQCARGTNAYSPCSSPVRISDASGKNNQFKIRAIDKAGNYSPESQFSWDVDTSVPSLSFTSKPAQKSNQANAKFEFIGTDDGGSVRFECKLNSGSFSSCASGISFNSLAQGEHTFVVRGIDNVGNKTDLSFTWEVDTILPTVVITRGVSGRTKDTAVDFAFSVSDSGTGIKETFCSIDGATYRSCTGTFTWSDLAEGNHRFNVMTRDNAGNDSAPASRDWTVDLTRPTVQITQLPANPTLVKNVTIGFSAADANGGSIAGTYCSVDGQAEVPCSSPFSFEGLADGNHVISVKAIDSVGHVSDVASTNFKVDANAPSISLLQTPDEAVSTVEAASLEYRVDDASEIRSIRCGFEGALNTCGAQGIIDVKRTTVGSYKFIIEAEDIHGHTSSIDHVWRVEQATRGVTQNFQTTSNNMIDVVVIIDNSGSMDTERRNVGSRFGSFLDKLDGAGLDWRIGVMSTAVDCERSCDSNPNTYDGYLRDFNGYSGKYILDRSVGLAAAKTSFQRTIEGSIGWVSSYEQGIAQSWNLINRTRTTWGDSTTARAKNFFRDGASLSVIIVSDADETPWSSTRIWNKPDELIKVVKSKWPSKSFSFHSIIVKPNDSACKDAQMGAESNPYGVTYNQLSQKTGGIVGSVCAADYATQLGTMGQASLDQIRSVNLSCAPLDEDGDGKADIKVDDVKITNPVLSGLKLTLPNTPSIGNHKLDYVCLQ